MGCQSSTEQKNNTADTLSQPDPDNFKINYREFVRSDVGDVFQFYHFSKILSRSSTSLIRKVIHRTSKIQRVCKIISTQKKHIVHSIKQVQNLRNLDHPNVVQVQQYYFDKIYLYIIMQNIDGMRLSQFSISYSSCSLDSLMKIFQQLLSGVNYCHKKGLVHNCIHPDNLMIMQKNKEFYLKIIDFSFATIDGSLKTNKTEFPKQYQLFNDPLQNNISNSKNDTWSCALVFLFLISGTKSFNNFIKRKSQLIQEHIICFDIEKKTENSLVDLLNKMLDENISNRFTVEEALKHQIFNQFKQYRPKSQHRKKENNLLSRLINFKVENSLQSVFWMYACLNLLSSAERCEYMTQFSNLDKNKDGKLDRKQIKQGLMKSFQLSQQQASIYVQKIFNQLDKNNNNYLQYSQFIMATSSISKRVSENQLEKIFTQLDFNKDGYITSEQLGHLMGGVQAATNIMKDKKKVSLKDFKQLMFQVLKKSQISQRKHN